MARGLIDKADVCCPMLDIAKVSMKFSCPAV